MHHRITELCLSLPSLQWGAHHSFPHLGLGWALGKGAAQGQG